MDGREHAVVPQLFQRAQRRVQPEEPVEIDRAPFRTHAPRPRHGDRRPQPVVRLLAVWDEDIERIRSPALKETDERLAAAAARDGSAEQLRAERRAA